MTPPIRLIIGLLLCLPAIHAHSDSLLELDFNNFDPVRRTTTASAARADASPLFALSESGATIDPAALTGIASENEALQKGVYEADVQDRSSGCLDATSTSLKKSGNAKYSNYIGGKGYGTGTLVIVFQPNFSGSLMGNSPSNRFYLFASDCSGTAAQAVVFNIANSLNLFFGIGAAASGNGKVSVAPPQWDHAKWYFLAASWSPAQKSTVYWREIGGEASDFASASEPLTDIAEEVQKPIRLGNSGGNSPHASGTSPMRGKMSYFLWTDVYTATKADFEQLYFQLVKPK